MKIIKAELITGDFENNTMTFEIEGEMILVAGKYIIIKEADYHKMRKGPELKIDKS